MTQRHYLQVSVAYKSAVTEPQRYVVYIGRGQMSQNQACGLHRERTNVTEPGMWSTQGEDKCHRTTKACGLHRERINVTEPQRHVVYIGRG